MEKNLFKLVLHWLKSFDTIFELISFNKIVSEEKSGTDVIIVFKCFFAAMYYLSNFELEKQCFDWFFFSEFHGFPNYILGSTPVWLFKKRISDNCKEK